MLLLLFVLAEVINLKSCFVKSYYIVFCFVVYTFHVPICFIGCSSTYGTSFGMTEGQYVENISTLLDYHEIRFINSLSVVKKDVLATPLLKCANASKGQRNYTIISVGSDQGAYHGQIQDRKRGICVMYRTNISIIHSFFIYRKATMNIWQCHVKS